MYVVCEGLYQITYLGSRVVFPLESLGALYIMSNQSPRLTFPRLSMYNHDCFAAFLSQPFFAATD